MPSPSRTFFSGTLTHRISVETVKTQTGKEVKEYPEWENKRVCKASTTYINSVLGLKLNTKEIVELLTKMSLVIPKYSADATELDVVIPPTRSDILHECDIMEDVGIAYGFNRLPKALPDMTTEGKPLPINKLSDILRAEMAQNGYTEMLSFALVFTTYLATSHSPSVPRKICIKS